jgi:prephenate dehydratase
MTKKISFQGELGAYSHMACRAAAPGYEPLPCSDFETAILAVREKRADLAMLPIDNTIAGRVADIHFYLPKSGLHIIGEFFMPVRHALLGIKGAKIGDIKTVTSHLHALPQCRDIIARHKWQKIITSDTALAAKEVAERNDKTWAAIASELAGEIYGLDILQKNIADHDSNTTRFIIMSREEKIPPVSDRVVTSVIFRVRSVPAALYKALGGFATNGLNLTKLESYFVDGGFDAAEFYCEIEGHPDTIAMRHAMDELNHYASSVMILGVYPMHDFRSQ